MDPLMTILLAWLQLTTDFWVMVTTGANNDKAVSDKISIFYVEKEAGLQDKFILEYTERRISDPNFNFDYSNIDWKKFFSQCPDRTCRNIVGAHIRDILNTMSAAETMLNNQHLFQKNMNYNFQKPSISEISDLNNKWLDARERKEEVLDSPESTLKDMIYDQEKNARKDLVLHLIKFSAHEWQECLNTKRDPVNFSNISDLFQTTMKSRNSQSPQHSTSWPTNMVALIYVTSKKILDHNLQTPSK